MKKNIFLVFTICLTSLAGYGQSLKQYEQSFDRYIEIDSSNTVMIPIDWEENGKISNLKIMGYNRTKNIFFYDPITEQQNFLFKKGAQIILSYSGKAITGFYRTTDTIKQESLEYLFYRVINEDFNNDEKLSKDDPTYLFSSKTDGTNVQRLTPSGYHLKNYKLLANSHIVLATLVSDEDQNKKFNQQDAEVLYRIDLKDISASKIIAKINIKDHL